MDCYMVGDENGCSMDHFKLCVQGERENVEGWRKVELVNLVRSSYVEVHNESRAFHLIQLAPSHVTHVSLCTCR